MSSLSSRGMSMAVKRYSVPLGRARMATVSSLLPHDATLIAAKVMARISLVVFIFLYYTLILSFQYLVILSFQYLVSKFNSYAFRCVYQTAVGSHEVLLAHCLFQRDAHDVGMVVGYHLSEAAFHDEFHGADAELGG